MRKIKKRKIIYNKDQKYNSRLISYFINNIMTQGKKNTACKIIYKSLNLIKKYFKDKKIPELNVVKVAIKNSSPELEIKTRKIGGATYNIPIRINKKRKKYLAIKWLIINARNRSENTMYEKLANEIVNAYNGIGNTIKKKNQIHNIAKSNKAFSHFKF
ncbi:MAG: 30S ribosomal protein S7 [Candidatus Shikimatogenerans bostrichidophilus]|nr:MAG: 30S ribosomal protein S7 [Candidatus Shikimatogenerans bostrichidophilus]